MKILKLLDELEIIQNYNVLDYKSFGDGIYYKIEVIFKNQNILHIKEYMDEEERNYSYHFQDKNGNLITRWDNAPHHQNIITYPHHRHIDNKIIKSFETTIDEILELIKKEYY